MYLTVSIIPVICGIVQESSSEGTHEEVVKSFLKALDLLRDMAPTFALTQLMLRRLDAAISVAQNAIGGGIETDIADDSIMDAAGHLDSSPGLLDLFKEL